MLAGPFGMGGMEMLVILAIVLIVFGAGKLPEVMGQFGKGLRSFKDAANGGDAPRGEDAAARSGSAPPKALSADDLDDPARATSREHETTGR